MHHVELSKRAKRDLRKLQQAARDEILRVLEQELAADPQPENLAIKALAGHSPWLRLRRGSYRVLYRPMTDEELTSRGAGEVTGFLVERIVHRKDLERAARGLKP